jgi:hypothetical protein
MIARDTTPAAAAVHQAALRGLGPEGRLLVAFELSDLAHRLAVEGIRRRQQECSHEEAIRLLALALYGVKK